MIQSVLTIVVPIKCGCQKAVAELLHDFNDPAQSIKPAIGKALTELGIVHFLSMSVIPEAACGQAHLFWDAGVDGEADAALQCIGHAIAPWLLQICQAAGVPAAYLRDLPSFLRRYRRPIGSSWWQNGAAKGKLGLTFCGAPGIGVGRILQEEALAGRIAAMATDLGGPGTAMAKLRCIRDILWAEGEWKWAFLPLDAPFLSPNRPRTLWVDLQMAAVTVPALLWPVILMSLAVALLAYAVSHSLWWSVGLFIVYPATVLTLAVSYLRYRETTDAAVDQAPLPAQVARIMQDENRSAINLMVLASNMKPGEFRRITLRTAFLIIGQIVSRSGTPGFLGDIGVVHFLQWALLPDSNQLIFVSHYDGSWGSYLEDFINLVPQGPSAIWSNCAGFPRTRFLFFDGATDGDRFRQYARRQQIPSGFWYAAYPELTLERIRINAQIRRGLATADTDRDAQAWLALFGGAST